MSDSIYLDNSAVTRVDEQVFEAMKPCFLENYAVATSEFGYSLGLEAREILAKARATIADSLAAAPEEIIFTSGSTESSNLAIKGVIKALDKKNGDRIIVSAIEDFPVLHSAKALEKQGYNVDYLPVDQYGLVDIAQLEKLLTKQTALVSIQHGNQEIGTIQDIQKIASLCKTKGAIFHCDATHSYMRVPLDMTRIAADLVTISAHTIHGPKGVGALYVRKDTPIVKITDGGYQEFDLRPGVENIPGAVGFAKAVDLITDEENQRLIQMRDLIIDLVKQNVPLITLNGHPTERLPQNANITFHNVEGESITLHLDMYGIAVSTGSACFSRSLVSSHVIAAIGGDHERAHGSIRFSFSRFNTIQQVQEVVDTLAKVIGDLRRISPLGKSGGK